MRATRPPLCTTHESHPPSLVHHGIHDYHANAFILLGLNYRNCCHQARLRAHLSREEYLQQLQHRSEREDQSLSDSLRDSNQDVVHHNVSFDEDASGSRGYEDSKPEQGADVDQEVAVLHEAADSSSENCIEERTADGAGAARSALHRPEQLQTHLSHPETEPDEDLSGSKPCHARTERAANMVTISDAILASILADIAADFVQQGGYAMLV